MPVPRLLLSRQMGAFLSILSIFAFASTALAGSITLNATDSGWHSSAGNHTFTNENYNAGWSNDTEFRNFFVFDLAIVPAGKTLVSATLRLYNPAVGEPDVTYTGGYSSPNPNEAYRVREVLLPSAVVTAPTIANTAVYDDLGDGASFGQKSISGATANGSNIDIVLNAAGLSFLATRYLAGTDAVLGGEISTLARVFGTEESVWGHTDPPNGNQGSPYARQLIVVFTPEPGTALLLGFGLAGIAAGGRRRQNEVA